MTIKQIYDLAIKMGISADPRGKERVLKILKKEAERFKEAKKSGMPVIAVCNTNCSPSLVDYVIPGNDESVKSISFFTNLVADAIIEAKKEKGLEDGGIGNDENPRDNQPKNY